MTSDNPTSGKRIRGPRVEKDIDPIDALRLETVQALRPAAAARSMKVDALVRDLLETIVADDLVDALLDDGVITRAPEHHQYKRVWKSKPKRAVGNIRIDVHLTRAMVRWPKGTEDPICIAAATGLDKATVERLISAWSAELILRRSPPAPASPSPAVFFRPVARPAILASHFCMGQSA